ncbi:hypothetical protein [Halobacillus litoralis]|uniref:Uncharacterized protein n=3 Tax=Halobacillus TaxID=45667 RepID=A0A410MCB7_9BACI|nr:hypothetical protein [Halobacillus litoralis]QAS52340.1 hypothetical protein HLI_08910 [Halobacillus litoralis]REJ07929.1 hypothetical protein DYE48_14910 [Halobacillus trueperi]
MRVLFTSKMDGEISSFHPYSFQEIVVLTAELDAKLKKKNAKPILLDFMIFNEEGDKLYNGSYEMGAEGTSNIYDHVCQKLLELPMQNKNEETKRDVFLQQLTSNTPASYQIDMTGVLKEKEVQKSSWKQLGKRGKFFVSMISTTLVVAIVTSITLFILLSNQGKDLRATTQELEKTENVKTAYEGYWTGQQKKAVDQLQGMETLTESERKTLLHFLVELKKYDQALQYVGKENSSSLAEQVMKVHGLEELISFQEAYPSPLGEFKIAFHNGEYKQAVDIQDMAMSPELYKQKGIAYLRLGQLEDAKKMASEAKNDELNKKINEYQEIEEQLTKINSQIETEKKSEDQNQSKIDSLKEQQDELEGQKNNI